MNKRSYKVVGSRKVAGVSAGGSVYLDSEAVNISALIEAGHIEAPRKQHAKFPVPAKESAPVKAAEEVAAE